MRTNNTTEKMSKLIVEMDITDNSYMEGFSNAELISESEDGIRVITEIPSGVCGALAIHRDGLYLTLPKDQLEGGGWKKGKKLINWHVISYSKHVNGIDNFKLGELTHEK